jgi:hypothetical protein
MRPLLLALALLACGAASPARAADDEGPPPRIYRWVDENGIAHYTTDPERIPKSLRRRYGLPAEPLRSEPLDARAPAPPPAPTPAGPEAWAAQEKREAPPAPPGAAGEPAPAPEAGSEWKEGASTDVAAGPPPGSASERLAQIELRIAELSASIAADEDALSAWIGDPAAGDAVTLGDKPEFREIAKRLPKRIQELEALRRERDALETAIP